jgi:hypothetical protein
MDKDKPEKVLDFQLLFESVEKGDLNYLRANLDSPALCDTRVFLPFSLQLNDMFYDFF